MERGYQHPGLKRHTNRSRPPVWLARQGTPSTVAMKQIISFYIPDPHDFLGYMLHFYGFSSFELLVMFIITFFYLYKNTGGEPPESDFL